MTTSAVDVTSGTGTHVATYSITEDAETKQIQRTALNDASGANTATVRAGSSLPAASDPALVVTYRDALTPGPKARSASAPVVVATNTYKTVAASQTDSVLGTGAAGDYLEGLTCVVATAATSQVQIKDGAGSAITVLPNAVGGGVGTYYVPLGMISGSGAWKITTAAGVSVVAIGDFTP